MDPPATSAAVLSDALRKLHPHRHHVLDLVTPTPGRVLFGPAATMAFVPHRADVKADFEAMLAQAVGERAEGKVLVCASPGAEHAAVAGGVRLAHVERLRLAGLLTTARLRDFGEIARYRFAAYCRGETPLAGSAEAMPVAANVPVALDGATVVPGDYVYVDASGAVVIPAKDLEKVLELARQIEKDDEARVAKALKG